MKFTLDQPTLNMVRAYGAGMVRISDRTYDRSVIVTATVVIEDWPPRGIDDLRAVDLEPLLQLRPEVMLIGSGARQKFPVREVLSALYASRLGFEIMDTGAACRTYNVLAAEGRNVAAALILEPAT